MRHADVVERLLGAGPALAAAAAPRMTGRVASASGMLIEVGGLSAGLAVGDRIQIRANPDDPVGAAAEVVGFRAGMARALTFGALDGLGPRSAASLAWCPARPRGAQLAVSGGWIGRVVDPLGMPLDGRGALPPGVPRPVRADPPPGAGRARLGPRIGLGVRALDLFATCRRGQRLGLFAGSGVGKSTLMAQLVHQAGSDVPGFDVAVLALVGERGREVREFLEDDLGDAGLARAVAVVATSDQPPLMRREAAYAAMTVAEHFRDQGLQVLLLMDSVTRFCLALREIGLAAGEPPATRGYPPSVFAELPRLLERAGPGPDCGAASGHITALFTVLVEGDDHNEPVADAVRGILDGHVILDRRIAEGGRYPAVDVLRSLSRTVPGCLDAKEAALARRARAVLATQAEMADLVRLGAYRPGTDPATDEALRLAPRVEALLHQAKRERSTLPDAFAALADALKPAESECGGAA